MGCENDLAEGEKFLVMREIAKVQKTSQLLCDDRSK